MILRLALTPSSLCCEPLLLLLVNMLNLSLHCDLSANTGEVMQEVLGSSHAGRSIPTCGWLVEELKAGRTEDEPKLASKP